MTGDVAGMTEKIKFRRQRVRDAMVRAIALAAGCQRRVV
jgi:hypothetical protein